MTIYKVYLMEFYERPKSEKYFLTWSLALNYLHRNEITEDHLDKGNETYSIWFFTNWDSGQAATIERIHVEEGVSNAEEV